MNPLSATFPNRISEIAARRARDAGFDEICADFEALFLSLPDAARDHRDAAASLRALEGEIRRSLDQSPNHPKGV